MKLDAHYQKIGKHEAENEVFRHFAKYDADKDGSLTREEFHAALQAPPYNVPFIQREKLHGYMDVDGDGIITQDEIKDGFSREDDVADYFLFRYKKSGS